MYNGSVMQISDEDKNRSDDFQKISAAIHYSVENQHCQPNLREVANSIGISSYYLQRIFTRWVGVSLKHFLHHLTLENTKARLSASERRIDEAFGFGLSCHSYFQDLFITTEAVTPAEFKSRGAGLTFIYGFHPSVFGEMIVVLTNRGLCGLGFTAESGRNAALVDQQAGWESGRWCHDHLATLTVTKFLFYGAKGEKVPLSLLLRGTPFQIKVWEALLKIPTGAIISYANLAALIGTPNAARPVGTACSANRLGVLIPCHRVIRGSGIIDGYRWGTTRKRAILAYESVKETLN